MSFLEKLFPKQQPVKPSQIEFILAKHFRGFKRFPMVVHGHKEAEENNERLKDMDFPDHTIAFRPGSSPTYKDPFYLVFIDNLNVGAIFDKEHIKSIKDGKITAVYAKSEEENVASGKNIVKRHRIRLFVKYKEAET